MKVLNKKFQLDELEKNSRLLVFTCPVVELERHAKYCAAGVRPA